MTESPCGSMEMHTHTAPGMACSGTEPASGGSEACLTGCWACCPVKRAPVPPHVHCCWSCRHARASKVVYRPVDVLPCCHLNPAWAGSPCHDARLGYCCAPAAGSAHAACTRHNKATQSRQTVGGSSSCCSSANHAVRASTTAAASKWQRHMERAHREPLCALLPCAGCG